MIRALLEDWHDDRLTAEMVAVVRQGLTNITKN
jgi:hypothetical protein